MLTYYSAIHSSYGLSLKAFVVLVFSTSEYLGAVSILDDIVEILGCELSPVIPHIFPSDTLEPHFYEFALREMILVALIRGISADACIVN
jgi:hypothetical protein